MIKHKNDGSCLKCLQIIRKYPNFNLRLFDWFKDFQSEHPEFHISCAGRGRLSQEEKKAEGKSKAGWGESAHNWNCAIDLFINGDGHELYDEEWFEAVLSRIIPAHLEWYGRQEYKAMRGKFWELPHVELKHWRLLRDKGQIHLVEGDDD